MHAEEKIEER